MKRADLIEQKVRNYISRHRMILPGDRVVAGVSGGADSVCLLFVLLRFREEWNLDLHAVHVNHGIRREAAEDAAYVGKLCEENGVKFTLVTEDVRAKALREKRSEEEMGRRVRYEAFESVRKAAGADKIAVAHNSNDQAETVLFHLFRGSGLSGLCGIRPVREKIIRPLLCLERQEIEEYLSDRGIPYCHDVTNEGDDYTRNRIRHHILPYAEENISENSVQHISNAALMLQETEALLDRLTLQAGKEAVSAEGGSEDACSRYLRIDLKSYAEMDPVIGKRLLYQLLKELSPEGKDIGYVHVSSLEELACRPGSRMLSLPCGIEACRRYEELILYPEAGKASVEAHLAQKDERNCLIPENTEIILDLEELSPGKTKTVSAGGQTLYFQMFPAKKSEDIPQNRYTKWFDYDKINGLICVRTRRTGDYLSIRGAQGETHRKMVKDYMVTEKIPVSDRDRMLILAEEDHVLWLAGYRISEHFKTDGNTKRILQVQLRRGCEGCETEEKNGREDQSTFDRGRG